MSLKDPQAAQAALIDCLPIAVAVFDGTGRLVSSNAAYGDLWNLESDWLAAGPDFGQILDRLRGNRALSEQVDFAAYRAAQLARFQKLGATLDELLHLPDGRSLRQLSNPVPGGGLVMAFEDVSGRLATERRLNEASAVLAASLDGLREGLAVFGADGRMKLANPAFRSLWEMEEGDVEAGPHINQLLDRMVPRMENPEQFQAGQAELAARFLGRRAGGGRLRLGDGRLMEMSHAPLPDGAVMLGFRGSTESEQAAQTQAERARELEAALGMKARFLANLSHELRTPLTTISGFAEILTGGYFGQLNSRQAEYAEGIHGAAQGLAALVSDIMDLANMEAGLLRLELDSFDLHLCLAGLLGLVRERARGRKLTLEFDCAPDLGWVTGDERRIRQAVLHLLGNAVTFTGPGGTVSLGAHRQGQGFEISVADTGAGIPKAELTRIRQGLERGAELEGENTQPGAGLGLSLVGRFMDLHGGSLKIKSTLKRGTTVSLTLPG